MKNKILKSMFCCMAAFTMVTAVPTKVEAANLVNSTASSAEDESAGEDITQGVKTQYVNSEEIESSTYSQDEITTVYATKTSNVVVRIPKVLTVGKDQETKKYKGTFNVKVTGDIAGSQTITITPTVQEGFSEVGGKASNTQTTILVNGKQSCDIDANQLADGKEVVLRGSIETNGITAGRWKSKVAININVKIDGTN